jgi:hypothetical protein
VLTHGVDDTEHRKTRDEFLTNTYTSVVSMHTYNVPSVPALLLFSGIARQQPWNRIHLELVNAAPNPYIYMIGRYTGRWALNSDTTGGR